MSGILLVYMLPKKKKVCKPLETTTKSHQAKGT